MHELAPPVDLEIEGACPECGAAFTATLPVAKFFISELRQAGGIEREVHCLAWHYHWSEADILSLTRSRRRRYLDLIDDELERVAAAQAV